MSSRVDAGLTALARARSIREQDSRTGLQQALAEQHACEAKVRELRDHLMGADRFEAGRTAEFVTLRAALQVLGGQITDAEEAASGSRTISESAYEHWRSDRVRLAAVETLLERRAERRRAEAARREARDLDEVAGQLWQRRHGGSSR